MPDFDVDPLLEAMLDAAPTVSDLNLSVGRPPQVEVDGQLRGVAYASIERLMPYHTELIALRLMRGKKDLADRLVRTGSADLSYSLPTRTRFRVNIFSQRGSYSIVLRVIPNRIPTVEELGLPSQLNEITRERNGIVLVTGPTGSGKSTTLAALINRMNHEKAIHIVTIEDPIEYLYRNDKATINQREIGTDTEDFANALRAALRQAPKVILVGVRCETGRPSPPPSRQRRRGISFSRRFTPSTPPRPSIVSWVFSPRTKSVRSVCGSHSRSSGSSARN